MAHEDVRIERYLREHNLEAILADAVLDALLVGAPSPLRHIANYLVRVADGETPAGAGMAQRRVLKAATWNIAAINNNPFEYWITHDDPEYNLLMAGVQAFISDPGERDVPVSEVFSAEHFSALHGLMAEQDWTGLDKVSEFWHNDLSNRKIVSGFMKDKSLGDKRLASMPDRVTNTIDTADQGRVFRPTVISCYSGDLSSQQAWWKAWSDFMFRTPLRLPGKNSSDAPKETIAAELLGPIKRAKYPAITEEEEAISIPLQTLCAAVFDSILVHIVNTVSPSGAWQTIKAGVLAALYDNKLQRTLEILAAGKHDILFVQEASSSFPAAVSADTSPLCASHFVVAPEAKSKSDQNSLLLLSRAAFDEASVVELTNKALGLCSTSDAPVAAGDLLAISVKAKAGGPADLAAADGAQTSYLLASFHGDTNGLASLPVLQAVHALAQSMPEHLLIFGLDANTAIKGKPGKIQGVEEFAEAFTSLGYSSCWGSSLDASNYTTYCARTFLQPQLQKACALEERATKGDRNPKDFVLFSASLWTVETVGRDNTGEGRFEDEMVLPTLAFPSDHALLAATIVPK